MFTALYSVLLISSVLLNIRANEIKNAQNHRCEEFRVKHCAGNLANTTLFPNLLGHRSQEEADQEFRPFLPFINGECNKHLKPFICSVFFPSCKLSTPLRPCRHLCLKAQNECEALMQQFGWKWREDLDCGVFPIEGICQEPTVTTTVQPLNAPECPNTMRSPFFARLFVLELPSQRIPRCSFPCPESKTPSFFDAKKQKYIGYWTLFWAIFCFICSLTTLCTFIIDMKRFRYPMRPIFYISLCYLNISIIYVIGAFGGSRISCTDGQNDDTFIIDQGVNVLCSFVGFIHHFFNTASSMWWLILSFSCFLTATRRWASEYIELLWPYFHLISWGLSLFLGITALLLDAFDGDVFTGVCSTGNLQSRPLFWYFVLPQFLAQVLGACLMITGIISMLRIQEIVERQQNEAKKIVKRIRKHLARTLVFSTVYMLAAFAFNGVLIYQSLRMPFWIETWYLKRCLHPHRLDFGFVESIDLCPERFFEELIQPTIAFFLLKYFLQFAVGISCSLWILSAKTTDSYKHFCKRKLSCRSTTPLNN